MAVLVTACDRIVRHTFAEKVKHTLYGRRDAALTSTDATSTRRLESSNNGDNIARLLAAAATSAELTLLKESPDSKKRTRHFNGESVRQKMCSDYVTLHYITFFNVA